MPSNIPLSIGTVFGFVTTLTRVSGMFVFVPLPGSKSGMDIARVVLALTLTVVSFPYWPHTDPSGGSFGLLVLWIVSEAGLGIGIGLAVSFVMEAFTFGAAIMGLQAGYAYASTIDPNTQADSGILVVFTQLAAGLLFFATGADREVIRVFAASLQSVPPGSFVLTRGAAEPILAAGRLILSTGLRLALPVVSVLVMVDISLALLGRVNAQLQLLTIAFPIKMLVALTVLSSILVLFPTMLQTSMTNSLWSAKALLGK